MNYEILNDAFWKATRFGFNSIITDCFDGQRISIKDYIYKMIDNIMPSLLELGNENVLNSVEDVIDNGTEADQQLNEFQKNGMEGLLIFLMENVDYD